MLEVEDSFSKDLIKKNIKPADGTKRKGNPRSAKNHIRVVSGYARFAIFLIWETCFFRFLEHESEPED